MEIEVRYGRTVNKGNYESERIDVSLRHPVEEDDLPIEQHIKKIVDNLKAVADENVGTLMKDKKKLSK